MTGDPLFEALPALDHRPWPRHLVTRQGWKAAGERLAAGQFELLGLWGEARFVHLALRAAGKVAVLSLPCPDRRLPSIGALHAPAIRLERAVAELCGLELEDVPDTRRWLDHGQWTLTRPLGAAQPHKPQQPGYAFLAAEGEHLHQVPVGPVHAGIIEPGHFRFHCSGETIVRLEQRLGYTHKGTERLMAGAGMDRAAKLAGRISGDSTVAYALAFARACEAALEFEPPERAVWLRALMAEMERLANHLGDIGAICNDASFALMHAHCGILRERVLRAADAAFGHRLMRDRIVPGGVAADLDESGRAAIRESLAELRRRFPPLIRLYENTASLQDRTVGTGRLSPELARQYAAGGYVGRASGRDFDTRRDLAYPPYDRLRFEVPVRQDGDVDARVWIRIHEVGQSLSLIEQILAGMPEGPIRIEVPLPGRAVEGMALAEGFRGDILAWLRIEADGRIGRCHMRDPSWFQWPLLEAAVEGNIIADFPLCNKSFNCSYSGHDL